MLSNFFSVSSALAVLLAASQVDAHGHLVVPKASFSNKAMMSSFAGRIPEPNTIFTGANFPTTGTKGNYDEFMKYYKGGKQSLKQIITTHNKPLSGATKDCGFTVLGAAQAAPSSMEFGKNEGTSSAEGFRPTHLGACETYCDNTLVQQSDECATSYNNAGNKGLAKVPIQSAKCAGAKQLTFYWLATQAKDEGGFQVYVNCIALSGSAGASSSGNGNSTSGDADTKPATVKPSKASSASTDDGSAAGSKKQTKTAKTAKTKKPTSTKTDSGEKDTTKTDSGATQESKSKKETKTKKPKKDSTTSSAKDQQQN